MTLRGDSAILMMPLQGRFPDTSWRCPPEQVCAVRQCGEQSPDFSGEIAGGDC